MPFTIPGERVRARIVRRQGREAWGTLDEIVRASPHRVTPRCARFVLAEVFGRLRPSRAASVSCNPEALGRDLTLIVGHGYRIERLQPVDMFPHTPHVETVAVLSRCVTRAAATQPEEHEGGKKCERGSWPIVLS